VELQFLSLDVHTQWLLYSDGVQEDLREPDDDDEGQGQGESDGGSTGTHGHPPVPERQQTPASRAAEAAMQRAAHAAQKVRDAHVPQDVLRDV
jgi:hypothetical protein